MKWLFCLILLLINTVAYAIGPEIFMAVKNPGGPITWEQGNNAQNASKVSSVTFTKNDTVGSTLLNFVSCEIDQAPIPNGDVVITDSVENTWASVDTAYVEYKPNIWQYNGLFFTINNKGTGSEAITVYTANYYTGSYTCTSWVEEFSSSGNTLSPDNGAYNFQYGTYSVSGTVTLTGPTITPVTNGDLIYAIMPDLSSNAKSDTFSAGSGYTILQNIGTSGVGFLADEYQIQSSAGSISPTFGFSAASEPQQWAILAAAFKKMSSIMPVVTTPAVTNITTTSAMANGTVVSSGSSSVTTEGFVYGTTSLVSTYPGNVAPSSSGYANNVYNTGTFSVGSFAISLTGLSASTTYYGRAYSQNSSGYSYGPEISFITGYTSSNPMTVVNAWKIESKSGNTGEITLAGHGTATGPEAGNLLVVFGTDISTISGVSDNIDNTTGWTEVASVSGTSVSETVYYLKNIPSGITSMACNGNGPVCLIYEISGASTTVPYTSGESGCQDQTTSTTPATPAITNATANSILVAGAGVSSETNVAYIVDVSGSNPSYGWALYNATYSQEVNLAEYWGNNMPYITVDSSITNAQHVWTITDTPKDVVTCIAAFH